MIEVFMNDSAEFKIGDDTYFIDIKNGRNPANREWQKYVVLYKNRVEVDSISSEDISAVYPHTISEFIDYLKEAVNDKLLKGRINVTIPIGVYRDLFIKWK